MILSTLPVGALQVNCYVVGCERTRRAIVIDPGDQAPDILKALARHGLTLDRILGTHAHFDHLLACRPLQEATGVSFYLHPADRPFVAEMQRTCMAWLGYDPGEPPEVNGDLVPGEIVRVGDLALEVRHTPGHSPGGVTFVEHAERCAFTGDALFAGSVGRPDLPRGDRDGHILIPAIHAQILTLPDDFRVLPGHGPATTVGRERQTNPYL